MFTSKRRRNTAANNDYEFEWSSKFPAKVADWSVHDEREKVGANSKNSCV